MDLPRLLDGRLKLRHMALADALTTHGSLVGAGPHLHISQPAMTRALRELETIMGVELYVRGPRGVTPTIYGAAFTDYARSILAQLNQAGRHIAELADAKRGTVTIGADPYSSHRLIAAATAKMKQDSPHVSVIVLEGGEPTLLDGVESGQLDFVVGRMGSRAARPQLTQRRYYDEPVHLVARSGHPATRRTVGTLSELLDFPWVLPTVGTSLRAELDLVFVREALPPPRNVVETDSLAAVGHLLVDYDAITVLPLLATAHDRRLRPVAFDVELATHTIGVTTPRARPAGPATRALLRAFLEVAPMVRASAAA